MVVYTNSKGARQASRISRVRIETSIKGSKLSEKEVKEIDVAVEAHFADTTDTLETLYKIHFFGNGNTCIEQLEGCYKGEITEDNFDQIKRPYGK